MVIPLEVLEARDWSDGAVSRLGLGWEGGRVSIPVRDQTGEVLGNVRYKPGGSPKMLADRGVPRELFPPPEDVDSLEHRGKLWLVEGEPDAVRLWSARTAAVGVPGVKSWRREWAPRFAGPGWTVYVCLDADEEGRAASLRIVRDLVELGVDARYVDLERQPFEGKDLTDFLAGRAPLVAGAMLAALTESAQFVTVDLEDEPVLEDDVAIPWQLERWQAFRDGSPDSPGWLVESVLPIGSLGFLAGPPKKGKTWIGLLLALAIASGRPLFGEYAVDAPRDVVYLALEGSRWGLRTRVGALARGLGVDPEGDELGRLHLLYRPRAFDLLEIATASWLEEAADSVDAGLVVVDVLRAAASFEENAARDFARVRSALDPLLVAGRTVLLLHHFGKASEAQLSRSPGERMAGSGAMYAAMDVGLLITSSEAGAREIRLEIDARDFAAPDPLGVVIEGHGSGEHGGFTFADTAVVRLEAAVLGGLDIGTLEAHFGDGEWLTSTEVAKSLGHRREDVEELLKGHPELFVQIEKEDSRAAGRSITARPWGTLSMLARLAITRLSP